MSAGHSTPVRVVGYYRKSDEDDGAPVEQQRAWAHQVCQREGLELAGEFTDQARAGWDTSRRTDLHRMLAFCREQDRHKAPVGVILCWHTNRFSRADSQETSWFIWEFRQAGVERMFTATRRLDFGRAEDRLLFGVEQDFTNNPYVKNLALDTTRGRIASVGAGRWAGGPIPLGYRPE